MPSTAEIKMETKLIYMKSIQHNGTRCFESLIASIESFCKDQTQSCNQLDYSFKTILIEVSQ